MVLRFFQHIASLMSSFTKMAMFLKIKNFSSCYPTIDCVAAANTLLAMFGYKRFCKEINSPLISPALLASFEVDAAALYEMFTSNMGCSNE